MFFKKTKIYSPAEGRLIPIDEVNDAAFSTKMLGDGYAVCDYDGRVFSPVDGTIASIFPSKHAIVVQTKNGENLLLHIGIDTVGLDGNGFDLAVSAGDVVRQGDLLVTVDLALLKEQGKDDVVIVLFPESKELKFAMQSGAVTKDSHVLTIKQ